METNRIMNEIDNAENEQELENALAVIVDDIAAQVAALVTAVNDNPYVENTRLAVVLDKIHVEALVGLSP